MCVPTEKKQKSFIIKTQPSYNFIILSCKVFGVLRVRANQWVFCHSHDRWRWFLYQCMCTGIWDDYILSISLCRSLSLSTHIKLWVCVVLLHCVWVAFFVTRVCFFGVFVCVTRHKWTHWHIRSHTQKTYKAYQIAIEIDSHKI